MEIENFLPIYPDISEDRFTEKIAQRKEFSDLKLHVKEDIPTEVGTPLQNQELAKRYFSPHTDYDRAIVYNEVGTGKTCTAGVIVEYHKMVLSGEMEKAEKVLIVVPKPTLRDHFYKEIAEKCTKNVYMNDKEVRKTYKIITYGTFQSKVVNYSDFDNSIIILDEIHEGMGETNPDKKYKGIINELKIKKTKKKTTYDAIYDFLHAVKGARILLMTGTPIKDTVLEFPKMMNLLLSEKDKIPVEKFTSRYFNKEGEMINKDELIQKLKGKVSYIRGMESNAYREEIGVSGVWTKYLKVYPDVLSEFQADVISKYTTDISDKKSNKLHYNSILASNFVFSNGEVNFKNYKYGDTPTEQSVAKVNKDDVIIAFELQPSLKNVIDTEFEKHGIKFADICNKIKSNPQECVIVFIPTVVGSGGLIMFTKILEHKLKFQWIKDRHIPTYDPHVTLEEKFAKRDRIVTLVGNKENKYKISPDVNNFLKWHNRPENKYGAYFRVIVGSDKIKSGFTIKHVRQAHNVTPPWNMTSLVQRYGRIDRVGSHNSLLEGSSDIIPNDHQVLVIGEPRRYGTVINHDGNKYDIKLEDDTIINVDKNLITERYIRIYTHCSVESGNISVPVGYPPNKKVSKKETNDVWIYRKIEKKYNQTVQIYRLMKEVAWDCPLAYARNVRDTSEDGSLDCDLTKCNYVCHDYPDSLIKKDSKVWKYKMPKNQILDSYDLYYSGKEVSRVQTSVIKIFNEKFSQEFNELLADIDATPYILLTALDKIINDRVPIRNKFGMISYLYEENDVYYLTDSIKIKTNFDDNIYIREPLINASIDFEDCVKIQSIDSDKEKLKKLCRTQDIQYFLDMNYFTQISVLEHVYFKTDPLSEKIKKALNNTVFRMPDGTYIHTLYKIDRNIGPKYSIGKESLKIDGTLKMYIPEHNIWVYVTDPEVEERYNVEIKRLISTETIRRENSLGIYGRYKGDIFTIKFAKRGGEGKNCHSFHKHEYPELVLKFHSIGESILDDIVPEDEKISSRQITTRVLLQNDVLKDMIDENFLSTLTDRELQGLKLITYFPKEQSCKFLEEWLQRKDYIIDKI